MFLFRLAAKLSRTVEELLDSISHRELMEWRELYLLDPWDANRDDLRVAQLCALTANVNRDRQKHPDPFQIQEFMPFGMPLTLLDQGAAAAPQAEKVDASEFQGAAIEMTTVAHMFGLAYQSGSDTRH